MQLTRHRGTNAKKNERSFRNPVLLQHLHALVAGADCKGSGAKNKIPLQLPRKIKLAFDVSSLSLVSGRLSRSLLCRSRNFCRCCRDRQRVGLGFLDSPFVCFAERRRGARPNLGKLVKLDGEICRGGQSSATFCHESWQSSNIFVRIS